jgi:regulator of protease activity HflC (stomatin/prohibitin superfamily)
VLLAEAEANAAILRGTGEQEAIRVFGEAFNREPQFFQFWRSMQAYREVFSSGEARMVLTPGQRFLPLLPGHAGPWRRHPITLAPLATPAWLSLLCA